ncbi:MAG: hypothetical protein WBG17_05250 [Burkholderiaceae bacterium]
MTPNIHNCIQTVSGRYVNLLEPDPESITITDIARALSLINRFGGHTRTPYTVAQHSILVAGIMPREWQLHGLLHDAAEAYLGDMVQPLKHQPEMRPFRERESVMQAAIYKSLGLSPCSPDGCHDAVRRADLTVLATERRDLMPPDAQPWVILTGIEPMHKRIRPMRPQVAEAEFLSRFKELAGLQ